MIRNCLLAMNAGGLRGNAALSLLLIAFACAGCSKSATEAKTAGAAAASSAKSADAKDKDDAAKDDAKDDKDKEKDKTGQVELTPEQVKKIGLLTQTPRASDYADEAPGYGTILAHEPIAQAAAEVATAEATEKQSQSALARAKRLSGTPGALSSDVEESNARQAAVDSAALNLAKQRLTAAFGQEPPWKGDVHAPVLQSLAGGESKLVRVTFPLGTAFGETPKGLRISHLGAADEKRWTVAPLWRAPADNSVPGRSYFGVIRGTEFAEGERVVAWTPVGKARPGVLIPAAAVVVTDNKYWCYLQKEENTFVRTEIDASIALDDGYFVTAGVKGDDRVVTHGAAQLLAQESNTGEADAD